MFNWLERLESLESSVSLFWHCKISTDVDKITETVFYKVKSYVPEGFDSSETSYTFSRNPENPRESPRLPAESRRIPRIPMISTPQSYQESSRILWNPLESPGIPMNPQWIPRILKNPENPQDFPPINLGNLVQNFWSVAPLGGSKIFNGVILRDSLGHRAIDFEKLSSLHRPW